jgi:hypothetical protein
MVLPASEVEVCRVRNWLGYRGNFNTKISIGPALQSEKIGQVTYCHVCQ